MVRRIKAKHLITITALIGAAMNATGWWQGFLCWLVSNLYWAIYNWRRGEHEQAVVFAVFWLLCFVGIWQWRN